MADYVPVSSSDQELPPPPDVDPVNEIPVSFPPPPSDVSDVATKEKTAIKGTQLVKVTALKSSSEELAALNLTEGELYLATEAAGLFEQWQVWKPELEAERNFKPKKAFAIIDKNTISKSEKYEMMIQSLQSSDIVLLEACLAQSLFTPLQKGLSSEGECLYHIAATQGSPLIMQYLVGRKIGKNTDWLQRDYNGYTMLHSAANACKTEIIQVILDHVGRTDASTTTSLVNARDNNNITALAMSIHHQNREAINLLLRSGLCNYSLVNREGETVFHLACRMDDVETIQALKESFLNTEPLQESKIGLKDAMTNQSPSGTMPITLSHSVETIRLLLPYYEINSTEYNHQSTLLNLAVRNNNLLLTEILLEGGAHTDTANNLGHTALMQACRAGNREITAMLLENHADPEQILKSTSSESECTGTAIDMAAQNGHIECVKLLLQYSARVDSEDMASVIRIGALHASCLGGNGQMVNFFLEEQGMDPNQLNSCGKSPLFYAVNGRHYNVTEMLLSSGADPSLPLLPSKDGTSKSLLHLVVEKDSDKLLALLLPHSKVQDTDSLVELAVKLDRKRLLSQLISSDQDILQPGRQTGSLLHTVVTCGAIGSLGYLLRRLTKSCSENAIHFQIFERKAIFVSAKDTDSTIPVTSQKSVFELALDEKSECMLSLLLKYLRDPEYFQNNKALLHSMLDKRLFAPLKTAMDTMQSVNQNTVTLHTAYLDSDSTGLLPTNPDYQESDLSLLHKISKCPDQDILYHPTVSAVVSYKLPYYRKLFCVSGLFYVAFLIFLTLALHRASVFCDRHLFNYANDPFRLIAEVIVGVYFVVYIAYEVLNFLIEWDPLRRRYTPNNKYCQFKVRYLVETTNEHRFIRFLHKNTKRKRQSLHALWYKLNAITRGLFSAIIAYFCNIFRMLSFFSLIFLFLFFMMRLGISSSQWTFAGLSLFFFYLSLAEYSKIFPCFYSYLLRVLRAISQSLPSFLTLLSICVLAFVLAGHLLVRQDAMQQINGTVCGIEQNYLNSLYTGTNRLFVTSVALLIQSGISGYETEFIFRDTNWVLLLYILCFGFVFAILLPAFLLSSILFSFTQHQGSLSVQRCKLDIIHRTELHSGFAFLLGRRIRASTCVDEVSLNDCAFNQYIDTIDGQRESEILHSVKAQIGRVLYTNQNFLHSKSFSAAGAEDKTTEFETDTTLPGLIEQLHNDLQSNSTQTNKRVTEMFQKMQELDTRVASIYDYLTGVSVEIVT